VFEILLRAAPVGEAGFERMSRSERGRSRGAGSLCGGSCRGCAERCLGGAESIVEAWGGWSRVCRGLSGRMLRGGSDAERV